MRSRFATVSGFVLAGGASTRMGQDKATLVLAGETMLARQLRLLLIGIVLQPARQVDQIGHQHTLAQHVVAGIAHLAHHLDGGQILHLRLAVDGELVLGLERKVGWTREMIGQCLAEVDRYEMDRLGRSLLAPDQRVLEERVRGGGFGRPH